MTEADNEVDRDEKFPMLGHDLPIPTYEEATSSRAASEFGDNNDGEATSLLHQQHPTRRGEGRRDGYRAPTVESVRSSVESSFLEEFASARTSAESLQREMIQMEIMEAGGDENDGGRGGGGLRQSFSKRFSSISSSLSAISLPGNPFRGLRFSSLRIPPVPCFANLDTAAMIPIYRLLAVLAALVVVYILLATDLFNFRSSWGTEYLGPFDPESVRSYAERGIDKNKIKHWLEYVSSFEHMAGTEGDFVLAKYVQGQFSSFGFQAEGVEYEVYLNYPKPGGRKVWMDKPKWEATLEEPAVDKKHQNTHVFHGHSKSGVASGPIIYANYGSREDFKTLESQGVVVKGAIVLMRHGGTQPNGALKIKAAEGQGAVGALLFSDPKSEGWDWPDNAVMRGSVSLTNWVMGDVLTPGWASLPEAKRIPKVNNIGLLNIPSLPLSYKDARPLLQAIKGKGKKVDDNWVGGVPNIEYWTGSVDSSPVVHLKNEQVERDKQPVWNVLGEIQGTDRLDEKVVVGNHRDAWCFGASDPNSGTAVMLEVARVFGEMMKFGWRPRRGIIFANWDAKEYNMIGSTEYVEEAGDALMDDVIAYINIDSAVTGRDFSAAGSPALQSAMKKALGRVADPITHNRLNTTFVSQDMPGLGVDGDYAAFQHHSGISSIDISFTGKGFPQHSCYDNFAWVKDVGDPEFVYHEAIAKILALLVLDLADTDIIPLNMLDYWHMLDRSTKDLQSWVDKKVGEAKAQGKMDLGPLTAAITVAHGHITHFSRMKEGWMEKDNDGIYLQIDEWAVAQRRSRSIRMGNFDKHLLDLSPGGGVPGREWFRHMVTSPQAWSGDKVEYFPGVRDAVDEGNWDLAQREVQKVAMLIENAARKLLEEVSRA